LNHDEPRNVLELEADAARARLLRAVAALDRRRRELFDWRALVRRHLRGLEVVAGLLAAGTAVIARGSGRRSLGQERRRAMKRSWKHPERLAEKKSHPLRIAARAMLVGVCVLVTVGLARRQMKKRRATANLLAGTTQRRAVLPLSS
jgi:hypothetical protein